MHNLNGILLVFMTVAVEKDMKLPWKILQNCLYYTDHSGKENLFYRLVLNLNCFKRRYKWNHWINLRRIVYGRRNLETIVSFGLYDVEENLSQHSVGRVTLKVGCMIKRIINKSRRKHL